MCSIYLTGNSIRDGYLIRFIIYSHIYAHAFVISSDRYAIPVSLIKNNVVFPDRVVYTFFVGSFETVFRDRNQVFSFEGEYFVRSLICGSMFIMVSSALEPCDAVFVEAFNVRKGTMFCKTMLGKPDHVFYRSFRFRIGSAAEADTELYFIQIVLESGCINDISVVLAYCQYLVLIIYDLMRSAPEELKCLDMSPYKRIRGEWPFLPQNVFVAGV